MKMNPCSSSRWSILVSTIAAFATVASTLAADISTTGGVVRITPITRNSSESKTTLVLANNGKALFPIIVSSNASVATRGVANELATYLTKISGAPFSVTNGDGRTGIVVGSLTEFPTPELTESLAIYNTFDGREAFAIRTQEKRILLLGATDLGASHATFRFLQELGVRWLFPAKEWEVVPKLATVKFNRNITDRPSILSRNIWFEAGSGGAQQNEDYTAWKRHNLQAESFSVNAGHNLDTVINLNKAAFDAHPEYYALVRQGDGSMKRQGPQLELSNPAVRKMVVDYTLQFFKDSPNADMVSLDPADTSAHSESPESLAMGSVSERVFGMANEAGRALQKAYPGKMVGLYSYSAHWDPPSFNLEPNVYVLLCALGQGQYTGPERDKIWSLRSRNLGFYEYFSVWLWAYDKLPGSWVNNLKGTQGAMRAIVARGGTSVSAESTSTWGSNGRGYFMATKLMWNPDINVETVAQDFYEHAFGPGAEAMKRFYNRFAPDSKLFFSKHLMGLAYRDVDEASKQAKDRPDVQARLDQIKQYLRYNHLDWMRNRQPATEEQKAALTKAIMINLYRTRFTAMTAWEMIRQQWGGNVYTGAEWMVEPFYTHEETEREFLEGLAFFQPRAIGESISYSEELVPVQWPISVAVTNEQSYQGGFRYAFYSLRGEPIDFITSAGTAWGGINRFVFTDAKGTEIAKGQLPNGTNTVHHIKVPAPGLYYLDYNDNGSYWSISVNPGVLVTLPMGQNHDFRNSKIMSDMYFYVPKGIKQIEYFYTRTAYHPGGPHQVVDPAGKVVKDVDINGDWISIPVAAGMDGKLWRLRNPVMGVFWFNNIPNYIAASPDALMVPKEVAVKDGLPLKP